MFSVHNYFSVVYTCATIRGGRQLVRVTGRAVILLAVVSFYLCKYPPQTHKIARVGPDVRRARDGRSDFTRAYLILTRLYVYQIVCVSNIVLRIRSYNYFRVPCRQKGA